MSRRLDWQPILMRAIVDAQNSDFEWGEHDCCMFVASVVDQMTDGDFCHRIAKRFNYHSQSDVDTIIEEGGGLGALVDDFLHEPIPTGQAGQGDVVLVVDAERKEVLGICEGSQAICATVRGVIPFPMSSAVRAWRI